jgi:hypothetical protein
MFLSFYKRPPQLMKGERHMDQVRWYRALGLVAITPILSLTLAAQSGDPVAALQGRLNSQFKLTTTTKNLTEIVTAGDVVVLHKDGLKMSALASPLAESSTYKDGKIGGGGGKRFWGSLGVAALQGVAAGLDPAGGSVPADIPGQTFGSGQKFWVLAATAQKDGVLFKLYSDPNDNGVRYHADLKILYPNKKQVPPIDAALQLISEVLTVDQAPQEAAAPPPPPPPPPTPPPPQRQYDDVAPPPPPPVPAVTIAQGQTRTQVTTAFGEPQKKTVVGAKTVYYYTDMKMKVTFTNGKVSSIE